MAILVSGLTDSVKSENAGSILRLGHAFGAHFLFAIGSKAFDKFKEDRRLADGKIAPSDTSAAMRHVPLFSYSDATQLHLPIGCALIGVEILEGAEDLPSFHHPERAAYVLGPEAGILSLELRERCHHFIRIPTRYSINVATAAAIVLYDRERALGN